MSHRAIIAILRGLHPHEAVDICTALVDAGITRIEVPLNSPEPMESIARIAHELAGRGVFGAGTVLEPKDVDEVADAGGTFVVAPDANPAVIGRARERGLEAYPGVLTPTEAFAAIRARASGLKIFPASVIGPDGIKAMKAVLPPDLPVFAVGGAGPDTFGAYRAAGCSGVGMGSPLYKPGSSASEVGDKARTIVAAFDAAFGAT